MLQRVGREGYCCYGNIILIMCLLLLAIKREQVIRGDKNESTRKEFCLSNTKSQRATGSIGTISVSLVVPVEVEEGRESKKSFLGPGGQKLEEEQAGHR